ncbi:hypothetical protein VTK56DRAFT_4520 [Thermocarpiscus australiensis]
MDPTENNAGDLERRAWTRTSVRVSTNDVDEEDNDLASTALIADGFRPAQSGSRPGTSTSNPPSLTSASTAASADESPASPPTTGRPSSVSKAHMPEHSSSSRQESPGLSRHASTSTESTTHVRAESPYQGPSVPSHPYQMYPQNVRPPRTMSMTTSSTAPMSEPSYAGPTGPSHPYGLYLQNGGIEPSNLPTTAIPLGFAEFAGLPDQYQRRLGPDGEDVADIIGPDGHTEQLPPYTRYPEEVYFRKARDIEGSHEVAQGGATIIPVALAAPPSVFPSIPGAGGIGLATRDPEFESADDLGTPQSRRSLQSFTSDDSRQGIRAVDEGMSEKRKPPKKWQLWMRRKLWGVIPYWAICLTAVVMLLMGTVLGSVIGSVLAKQKKPRKDGSGGPPFDVIPIPTPSDLPPLPLGTYGMPLYQSLATDACFQDPSLSQAWNCQLILRGMQLTVSKSNGEYTVTLGCNQSSTLKNNLYSYGEQPPLIEEPATLELVRDKFEANRGPAWFKVLKYDKTVIVPEAALSSSSSSPRKRARQPTPAEGGMAGFMRKGTARPGDKPWVCHWPDTYLKLFIFPQQNSTFSNTSMSPPNSPLPTSSSLTTPPPSPEPTPAEGSQQSYPPGSVPPGGHGPVNTLSSRFRGNWQQVHAYGSNPTDSLIPPSTGAIETTTTSSTATSTGPFGPIDTGDNIPPPPLPYPRVIKLEESRLLTSGAAVPACTQVEIQGDGQEAKVLRDSEGEPIVIEIMETEPVYTPAPTEDVFKRSSRWEETFPVLPRDDSQDMTPCGCMWFLV